MELPKWKNGPQLGSVPGISGLGEQRGGQERRNRMNSERKWSEAESLWGRQVVEKFSNQIGWNWRQMQAVEVSQARAKGRLLLVGYRQETES